MKKLILSIFIFYSAYSFSQGSIPIPQIIGLPSALASKVDKVTGKSLVPDTSVVKLTGIQSGAQVNKLEGVQKNGVDLTITGKKVNITVPTTAAEIGAEPANSNIQAHISNTLNPHSVTKTQVGLGSVDNTSDANKPISTAMQSALNGKQASGTYSTDIHSNIGALNAVSGVNGGDETITSIKTKLGAATGSTDGYLKYQDFNKFNDSTYISTKDVRGAERLPSYYRSQSLTSLFNVGYATPNTYESGITVKGWGGALNAWQLVCGIEADNTDTDLYFRNGSTTWNASKKIWHSGNFNPSSKLDYRTFGSIASKDSTSFISIGSNENKIVVVCDGDSRTAGYTGTTPAPYSGLLNLGSAYSVYNTAVGGGTITDNEIDGSWWIAKNAFLNVPNKFSKYGGGNIVVIWAGWNDFNVRNKTVDEVYNALVGYYNARKKEGARIIVITEPNCPVTNGENARSALNIKIKNSFGILADEIADISLIPELGNTGAASNTTYFYDGVHMTLAGYTLVANSVNLAINRLVQYDTRILNKLNAKIVTSDNFVSNVNIQSKSLKLSAGAPMYVPTLGTATGTAFFGGDNSLYGTYFGTDANSGNGWIQQMRNDSPTSYSLLLNPVGGNVSIGYSTTQTEKLAVNGDVKASSFSGSGASLTGVQMPITLTTTGTSGAATFSGNTLNVPNYSSSTATIYQTQTIVNGSIGGTMVCSMPIQTGTYKKVTIWLTNINGTATYTFPTPFTTQIFMVAGIGGTTYDHNSVTVSANVSGNVYMTFEGY